jgi:hypothetical protein
METLFGVVLTVAMFGLALFFAWRQGQTLRWLKTRPELPPEDQHYFRRRSYRRLVGCVLLMALAGMFAGLYSLGILSELDRLAELGNRARAEGRKLTPAEIDFLYFGMRYIAGIGLLLFGLLLVAFFDLIAIRRYGQRHHKRLREARDAMLQRELAQLRREREGQE